MSTNEVVYRVQGSQHAGTGCARNSAAHPLAQQLPVERRTPLSGPLRRLLQSLFVVRQAHRTPSAREEARVPLSAESRLRFPSGGRFQSKRSLLFSLYFSTNQPCLKVASILARLRWQACFTAALSVRGGDSPEEPGCRRVLRGACPCFALVSGVVSSTIRANTNTGSHSVDIAIFVRCSRKVRCHPRRSFE